MVLLGLTHIHDAGIGDVSLIQKCELQGPKLMQSIASIKLD